ncbi:Xaa-Pro dipeptidase [Marinobacteraceae bacterium S3BR75-40.1]
MPQPDWDNLYHQHIDCLQAEYAQVLTEQGFDALLISSGAGPLRFGDDQSYPHHGFGPFLHWTGLAGLEHSWLLIRPDQRPVLYVYSPTDFWHAPPELPEGIRALLFQIEKHPQAQPPAVEAEHLAVLGDPALIGRVPGQHNLPALWRALDRLRIHKSDYEIACLREANALAAQGHTAARDAFYAGASEFEINLAYQQATAQREAEAPYHSIIGLNEHAGTLHYQHYNTRAPHKHRALLIDAGYRYQGYCSDITRTYAAPGENHFQALIQGVEQLQQRLCKAAQPGVDFVELQDKAHLGIAALLGASELVKGMEDGDMVESGLTRTFFPHGLGHFLGVQVHDVGGQPTPPPECHPALRLTHTLETGMVVTIEPGLYFIPSLLQDARERGLGDYLNDSLIRELQGCGGIRIEDNVVVDDRPDNLTRRLLP